MFELWFKTEKDFEMEIAEMEKIRVEKILAGKKTIAISDTDVTVLIFFCVYTALSVYSPLFGTLGMLWYAYCCLDRMEESTE